MRVGVLAIQGDFSKHLEAISRLGRADVEAVEVRHPDEIMDVDRLILPGGESTTVGLLMQRYGAADAILEKARSGMPIWGTCMGMIMLAKRVEGREQFTLELLDITVQRNAFGAQVHSFEAPVPVMGLGEPVMGVFIRAPIVTKIGTNVEVLSQYESKIVAVRQGNVVGTSYHPELTNDTRLHDWFLSI